MRELLKLTDEQAVWLRDFLNQTINSAAWDDHVDRNDDGQEHAKTIHKKLVDLIDSKKW